MHLGPLLVDFLLRIYAAPSISADEATSYFSIEGVGRKKDLRGHTLTRIMGDLVYLIDDDRAA